MSYNPPQGDSFGDLDNYNRDYKPEHEIPVGIDALPEGAHDFEILSATLERAKNNDPVLSLSLRTASGQQVKHTYWLNSSRDINGCGADLCTLGLAGPQSQVRADLWGQPGYELSRQMPLVPGALRGRKFRGVKGTDRPTQGQHAGKVFHKLHINSLIGGSSMPPTNGAPVPGPTGPSAPPPAQISVAPAPPASPEWWLLRDGQPVAATKHEVQHACDTAKDAARVQVCRQGTQEWRTADQCGFTAIPF